MTAVTRRLVEAPPRPDRARHPGAAQGCGSLLDVTIRKLSTTDAFVVVDLPEAPAAGIVRSAPKVLVDGARWLARSQTYQFASFERRLSGASAAINAAPDQRDDAVAAFVDELAADLDRGELLLEPAKGLSVAHAASLRAHDGRPALWWDHRDALRAVTVAAAVSTTAAGGRVAVEGFDESGPALVRALGAEGASIVAVATAEGTAVAPDGLDPEALADAWGAHGPRLVGELGVEVGAHDDVYGVSADVLVVGSRVGVVDHEVAAGLVVGAVVPSGPLPVTAKALAVLRRAEVRVLPDFVTTAGPLFAWPTSEGTEVDLETARAAAREAVVSVLGEVAGHPRGPLLGACERAEAFLGTWVDELPFGRPIA